MFEPIMMPRPDAVGLSATGTITMDDYERTLIPMVTDKMATHGKVRALLYFGPAFEGYSPGAIWRDATFGFTHMGDFSKVAVVSDVSWISQTVRLFAPFMRFPVHVFAAGELDAAKAWIDA